MDNKKATSYTHSLLFSFSILTSCWKVDCCLSCPPVGQNIKPFSCHYGYVFTAPGKLFRLSHFSHPSLCQIARIKKDFHREISEVMCLHNLCETTKVSVLKRYGPWGGGKPVLEIFINGFFFFFKSETFFLVFIELCWPWCFYSKRKGKKGRLTWNLEFSRSIPFFLNIFQYRPN